jgi:hypothetical protein
MNTANGEPEIDPEHYFDLKPLDENVLFAVSDPQVLSKTLTGAEQEAIDDAAFKRRENVLEKHKRKAALKAQTLSDDTSGGIEVPADIADRINEIGIETFSASIAAMVNQTGGEALPMGHEIVEASSETLLPYKADGSRNTVYLAGKMTGLPNFGFGAFDAARDVLTAKGFKVISPADIDREIGFDPSVGTLDDFDLPAAIRRDVDAILDCDAVVLLPGHETSKGATAERYVAKWAGIPCYTYPDLKTFEEAKSDSDLFNELAAEIEVKRKALNERFDKAMADRQPDAVRPISRPIRDPRNILEGHNHVSNATLEEWWDRTKATRGAKPVVTESPKADAKPNELRDGDTVTNERGGKQSFIAARFDCIPPECLRLLAQCLGYGAKRYGRENWRQIDIEDNIAHAMNHLNEWRRGDRSEPHLVNTLARVTFALSQAVASGAQSDTYVHPDA